MNNPYPTSRRHFLRQASAMTALVGGSAAPLALNLAALGSASAQSSNDYKALVCVFLYGGNDSFNTVLPTDPANWAAYSGTRVQQPDPLALMSPGTLPQTSAAAGTPARLGGILPINPINLSAPQFALHPLMGSMQRLFDVDQRLAILANVGPLIMPTTKLQLANSSHPRPLRLAAHGDHVNYWLTLGPEGVTTGWGGLMGDLLASQNSTPVFTAISATGNAMWLSGQSTKQYQVQVNGATPMGVDSAGRLFGSAEAGAALHSVASTAFRAHPFDADLAAVSRRTIDAERALRGALRPASDPAFGDAPASGTYDPFTDRRLMYLNPLNNAMTSNSLARQLQIVARMIDAGMRGALGARRQVFFVGQFGYDTHGDQNRTHANLIASLSHAMKYFDDTLGSIGARNQVTTFTASEFGRTFLSNGDGTDHGWGAHQFIMGGAVNGAHMLGRFPMLSRKNTTGFNFDGSPDQIGGGSLLPTTSVDQLGATLGRWMGLSDTNLAGIFPNLKNWNASQHDLGIFRRGA